jgi:hypothetical protein
VHDVLHENDIIKVVNKDADDLGLYQIKEITNDVKDGWWNVTITLLNHPLEFTWLLDTDHLHQYEFTMQGVAISLKLYARPMVLAPAVKTSSPAEIVSLF